MKPFQVKTVPSQYFQQNTTVPFTLPLNGKILKGVVILDGEVKITGGTTSGTIRGEGGPANLIKKIVVRANPAPGSRYPGGEIVNCTPRGLLRNAITEDTKFIHDLGAVTLGNGDAGTYQVYCAIPIYWADPNVMRQAYTSLNADPYAYQTIQVEVQTGDLTSCFTGNDRVPDFSKLQVRWFDERHNMPGDTFALYQEDHATLIAAAKTDTVDAGMPQSGSFLSWLLMTETTAAQTLADTILNKIKISGDTFEYDLRAKDVRQKMFNDGWYDAAQVATGQYLVDFIDGNIYAAVAAAGLTHELDVNMVSASNVDALRFFTRRIFSPSGFDANQMSEYKGK